jgi:hypothetical protein
LDGILGNKSGAIFVINRQGELIAFSDPEELTQTLPIKKQEANSKSLADAKDDIPTVCQSGL